MKRAACTNNDESRSRGEHGSEGTSAVQPGPFDVLLGRGKGTLLHVGNQRFQQYINASSDQYFAATSRHEKIHITQQVVLTVTQNGRFLKFNKNLQVWVEVPEAIARQKVCQALQYRRRKGSLQNGVSLGCNEELRGPAQLVSHSAAVLGASFTRHEAFAPLPKPQPFAASAATKVEIDESDTDFISLLRTLSQSSAEGDR